MTTPEPGKRHLSKFLPWFVATLAAFMLIAIFFALRARQYANASADPVLIEKLKSAKHEKSDFPAQKQTIDLARRSSLRNAALNAIGMEPREVRAMMGGNPGTVFAMLSHLGGFGEIIWVDQWTNFPVNLTTNILPRRDIVRAALTAIEASGGCLIKAGPDRYLVAKVSEREKYEAAIRALHWLDGTPPPWQTTAPTNQSSLLGNKAN